MTCRPGHPSPALQDSDEASARALERLTGVRSSKHTYYPEFRRKAQDLARAIAALEQISATLAMTSAGPEVLARSVVDVAALHFGGWAVMALAPEAFCEQPPTLVARLNDAPADITQWGDLPPQIAAPLEFVLKAAPVSDTEASRARRVELLGEFGCLGSQMHLGEAIVGGLAVGVSTPPMVAEEDFAVLTTLANQAAVALQSACLYRESERLRLHAAASLEMSEYHGKELELRNRQLQRAQDRLVHARQSRILDRERNRIARDLHDSVAQHLVSIGMNLQWCLQKGDSDPLVQKRLVDAQAMARQAVTRIRHTIFELSTPEQDRLGLRVALQDLAQDFIRTTDLDVSLRFVGRPVVLPVAMEHALFQVAQEAMFNVVRHSLATRATIDLRYNPGFVNLVLADNGFGDAGALRTFLNRPMASSPTDHHGLRNMAARMQELGGTLVIGRRRGRGVRIAARVPVGKRDESSDRDERYG